MTEYVSPGFVPAACMDGSYVPPMLRGRGYQPRDYSKQPYGSFQYTRRFRDLNIPVPPRSQWREIIEQRTKEKSRLSDFWRSGTESKELVGANQRSYPFCWAFAPTNAVMLRRRAMGLPTPLLSGTSVACPVTGFRQRGGYGAESLKQIAEVGICFNSDWPETSISRSYYTTANMSKAKVNRFTDWVECDIGVFEQLVACVFANIPCFIGVPNWRHEVVVDEILALPNGKFGVEGPNNWGVYNGSLKDRYQCTEQYIRGFDSIGAVSVHP